MDESRAWITFCCFSSWFMNNHSFNKIFTGPTEKNLVNFPWNLFEQNNKMKMMKKLNNSFLQWILTKILYQTNLTTLTCPIGDWRWQKSSSPLLGDQKSYLWRLKADFSRRLRKIFPWVLKNVERNFFFSVLSFTIL